MKKKVLFLVLSAVLALPLVSTALATEFTVGIEESGYNGVSVTVNGEEIIIKENTDNVDYAETIICQGTLTKNATVAGWGEIDLITLKSGSEIVVKNLEGMTYGQTWNSNENRYEMYKWRDEIWFCLESGSVDDQFGTGNWGFYDWEGKLWVEEVTIDAYYYEMGGILFVLGEDHSSAPATPTGNTLLVDGAEKLPAAYMINDNNYFKLRDVAALLNGTNAQFNIGWNGNTGAITITTGEAYTAVGGELASVPTDVSTAEISNNIVYVNGEKAELTAYMINDNNYFKLRDLGKALGFNVSWDGIKGAVLIESDKPYSDAD